jgi:hypothetical protein
MTVCGPWVLSQYYFHYMKPSQYWWELHASLHAVCKIYHTATSQAMAQAKPSQSQAGAGAYGLA